MTLCIKKKWHVSESTVDSSSAFRSSSFVITLFLALIGAIVACFSALLLGKSLRSVSYGECPVTNR
ncbi:hypothetical protein NC651_008180 [Populus alba x Populus x berolinensis]|nr:hypothetical protein NC651_008180 [Populus alba x Populus x berolinensis]